MMSFTGAGTKSSPIALDDSEDEVLYELSKDTSSKSSPILETLDPGQKRPTSEIIFHDLQRNFESRLSERKRKRGSSFASQDIPVAGPSHGQKQQQRNHPSLVNRLSQPESKKARKRRRKAERQALEDARLKNIDWLNNTKQFVNPYSLMSPHMSWSIDHQVYSDPSFSPLPPIPTPMSMPSEGIFPRGFLSYNSSNLYQEDATFNDGYISRSPSPPRESMSIPPTPTFEPPPTTSEWVSAMAMAAEGSTGSKSIDIPTPRWSPMPTELSLPPAHPPPLPPPPPPSHTHGVNPKSTTSAEFHHALPPKPPPLQPVQPIGMKPDQDPNSKHGIFHITPSSKEAGTDAKKKRKEQYIPNPARTLVMEQLPKTHRQPEFINKWSRSACGALPVHLFIDGPNAKALIEFATAELARKAWCSPKLGSNYSGLKPHQLKGKPREDLIKVWWYRVDGVGAGAGVGEIEEGEIEGDAGEKDPEVTGTKETKKERKARLAREREEKRLARENELKAKKEFQTQQQQQHQLPAPSSPPSVTNAVPNPSQSSSVPQPHSTWHPPLNSHAEPFQPRFANYSSSSVPSFGSFPWVQVPTQPPVNKTAYGASMLLRNKGDHDDNESIASSVASSTSDQHNGEAAGKAGQEDNLSDFEDEADMDVEEDVPITPTVPQPPIPPQSRPPPPLLHSSLPARPPPPNSMYGSKLVAQRPLSRPPPQSSSTTSSVFVPKVLPRTLPPQPQPQPQPQHLPQPPANGHQPLPGVHTRVVHQPQPQVMPTPKMSEPSVESHIPETTLTPVPSEPKAMKNAPTEPSFTKRALMARQKELEDKISKSKLELAAATATKSPAPQGVPTPLPAQPPLDNKEKQAMEDRLRNLVLKSQRAKAKPVPKIEQIEPPATISTPVNQDLQARQGDNTTPTTASSTISVSAHDFSLEDLAVSFITQTIETVKAHPNSVKPSAPAARPTQSQLHTKNELAAKQKRLEQHISETKSLMTRLSQSRSKEEKEILLKIMREKTRIYEEETKMAASTSPASAPFPNGQRNTEPSSVMNKVPLAPTAQHQHTTRWPVNQQDVGVLMISDDEDEDE